MVTAGVLSLGLFSLAAGISFAAVQRPLPAATVALFIYISLFAAAWAAVIAILVVRRPAHVEMVRVWSRVAIGIILASHLACLGVIWGLMPWESPTAQLVMAVLLISYVPAQLICSPENGWANRVGIIAVLGSLAVFFAVRPGEMVELVALYIAAFGIMMFIVGDRIRGTVHAAVAARLSSDETAVKLDRMLAETAAQRDAKTQFIAAASHDLGQPLAAAALFADLSQQASDDLGRAKAIDGLRRAVASAEQLLSHMLNHLRLEADAVEAHPAPVALRALLVRIAAQYEPAARRADIALSVVGANAEPLLDQALTERAIGNLVANAIEHSRGRRILLGARTAGNRIRLWVIDDGAGISPIDARHIFDDYYQGARDSGTARIGFGLGLSSVRRIATLMGGTAALDNRWPRGAAFYLEFPNTAPAARRMLAA